MAKIVNVSSVNKVGSIFVISSLYIDSRKL